MRGTGRDSRVPLGARGLLACSLALVLVDGLAAEAVPDPVVYAIPQQ